MSRTFQYPFFALLLTLAALILPPSAAAAGAARPGPVGMLISREILPYIRMVNSLEERLESDSVRIYLDQAGKPYSQNSRFQELRPDDFSVMVAVGPEALALLLERRWPGTLLYSMVLNPEQFDWGETAGHGISLNLDPWRQLNAINRVLPGIARLGVIFNPDKNRRWFDRARTVMTLIRGLELVPLEVRRRTEISGLFTPPGPKVDAILFIPDQTVISRSIITWVIKESLRLGIATCGFNRFFHESGAALSFVIDYERIGAEMAAMARAVITGQEVTSGGPPFTIIMNRKVLESLDLEPAAVLDETVVVE